MNRSTRPASSRWAIFVLTAAVLALAGCGRKGGLDLPPQQSSLQPAASSEPPASADSQSAANKGSALFAPASGADDGPPQATRGRKKPFILDPLLD